MDEMKKLAAAYKALREALENGDWFASLKAMADVVACMADAGKAVVGPFLPSTVGAPDVTTEMDLLEAECQKPRATAKPAGFDWTQLIGIVLSLIELWKSKK